MAAHNQSIPETGSEAGHNRGHNGLAAEIDELKSSFARLRSDLADLADKTVGIGKSHVKGYLHDIKEKGAQSAEVARQSLADHPAAGMVAGVAVGFVVAKLMQHRRS